MAQAARLNLRMQKELKLLLTDPPPGVSFPSLSDNSSSSLTFLDANTEGPEGTVYANGVFKIKIQIPERYPFQPPIVTFSTRIYHPNIDTGGRICLDILNLPPKSKEYKYNRAAFDQKARSMTVKYARAGESESANSGQGAQSSTNPSTAQMNESDISCENEFLVSHKRFSGSSRKLSLECSGSSRQWDSDKGIHNAPENKMEVVPKEVTKEIATECNQNHAKLEVTRQKQMLKLSDASHIRNTNNADIEVLSHGSSMMETQSPSIDSSVSCTLLQTADNHEKEPPKGEGCRLSSHNANISSQNPQEQSLQFVKSGMRSNHCDEKLNPMPLPSVYPFDSNMPHQDLSCPDSSLSGKGLYKDPVQPNGHGSVDIRHMKLGLAGRKHSLGQRSSTRCHSENNKENQAATERLHPSKLNDDSIIPSFVSSADSGIGDCYNQRPGKQATHVVRKLYGTAAKLPLKPLDQLQGSNNQLDLHSKKPSTLSKIMHVSHDGMSNEKQHSMQVHDDKSVSGFIQQEGGLPISETVIVLDSEDSEDENKSARSKLSLARKCFSRKQKTNIRNVNASN